MRFAISQEQRYSSKRWILHKLEKTVSAKNSHSEYRPPILAGMALVYYFFIRPQLRKWGTLLGEPQRRLPGDEIIPEPNFQMTNAINIDAPPGAVWPWIAQMGRERTGYYGLDLLDNDGIPSVSFIRQDLAAPEVGMEMDGGYHIMELEPNRKFLFGGFNLAMRPAITQDVSVMYLLERRRDGGTRILVRRRAFSYGLLGMIFSLIFEGVYFISVTRQLRRIKQYAESMAHVK